MKRDKIIANAILSFGIVGTGIDPVEMAEWIDAAIVGSCDDAPRFLDYAKDHPNPDAGYDMGYKEGYNEGWDEGREDVEMATRSKR